MDQLRPQVLLLGTFHMRDHEELHSNKRQDEIKAVVSHIEKFEPTKIAVEMVADKNEELNHQLRQYKTGNYQLEMNEIYQIGFRLASKLKHKEIYAIDWMDKPSVGYGEVEEWVRENQPELFKEIYADIMIPELTVDKSVFDYYKELNEPLFLNKLHKMYVNMARIGTIKNYISMEWLSWWYKRNLILYSNLIRMSETNEERILFIVGASHCTIISKFLEESETCEIVSPHTYLD